MSPKLRYALTQLLRLAAIAAIYWIGAPLPCAVAAQYMDNGDFIFDIREPADMTLVARLSGLTIKRDIPPRVGIIECARWARQFSIWPFSAVHSAMVPNQKGRVWICTGNANSKRLSRSHCKQMGMTYVRNDGPIVTCQLGNDT